MLADCNSKAKPLLYKLNRINHRQVVINRLPAFTTVGRKEQVAGGCAKSKGIAQGGQCVTVQVSLQEV